MVRTTFLAVAILLSSTAFAQPPEAPPGSSPHKVAGLELTAPQSVDADEGFVSVTAKCTGPVQWLVITTAQRVKYKEVDKELIIAVPHAEAIITVFAVSIENGKLTPFARTEINVRGPPSPNPEPAAGGKLHVTIIEDPGKRTPAHAAVINGINWRRKLGEAGGVPRVYDVKELVKTRPDLVAVANEAGPLPVVIIQQETEPRKGVIRYKGALPKSDAEMTTLIERFLGRVQADR